MMLNEPEIDLNSLKSCMTELKEKCSSHKASLHWESLILHPPPAYTTTTTATTATTTNTATAAAAPFLTIAAMATTTSLGLCHNRCDV